MTLDLNDLRRQLALEDRPASQAAVARLLLSIVHDANGSLGAAMLRGAAVTRSVKEAREGLEEGATDPAVDRLDAAAEASAELNDALSDLRDLFENLSEAAWDLEEAGTA